jgi:hypothetical protein
VVQFHISQYAADFPDVPKADTQGQNRRNDTEGEHVAKNGKGFTCQLDGVAVIVTTIQEQGAENHDIRVRRKTYQIAVWPERQISLQDKVE